MCLGLKAIRNAKILNKNYGVNAIELGLFFLDIMTFFDIFKVIYLIQPTLLLVDTRSRFCMDRYLRSPLIIFVVQIIIEKLDSWSLSQLSLVSRLAIFFVCIRKHLSQSSSLPPNHDLSVPSHLLQGLIGGCFNFFLLFGLKK